MCLVVRLLQPFDRDMSVDLRSRKALMPEQRLNAAKVSTVLQKMGREAMPELMRSCGAIGSRSRSGVSLESSTPSER